MTRAIHTVGIALILATALNGVSVTSPRFRLRLCRASVHRGHDLELDGDRSG